MSFPAPTERQARVIWLALTGLAFAVLGALAAALIWSLGRLLELLSPVIWPLAVGGILAYLLDPVVDFIEHKGVPRARAIVCVFALAFVIVGALFGSVVPQVITETRVLFRSIPGYADSLEKRLEKWINNPPPWVKRWLERETNPSGPSGSQSATNEVSPLSSTNAPPTADATTTEGGPLLGGLLDKESLQTATGWLAKVLPKIGSWLFGQVGRLASWFGVLAGLALVPVYTFYFLLEKRGISARWTDYLPVADSGFKNELVFVLNSINNYLIAFFRGQVLVAVCDGILYTIGFLIIGLPYAALIAALVLALVQFGDWLHPLLVLAVFAVVQTLEGLVISPKIMGGRVGLHPVTIIIAVMAGTTLLGGLLGGILAIPLTAALRVVMFRYVWKRAGRET